MRASLYDWGGGLVWIAGGEGTDAGAAVVRAAVAAVGGHATLVRAPDDVRNAVDVFQPLPAPLMALTPQAEGDLRPGGHPQPRPHVRGRVKRCRPTSPLPSLPIRTIADSEKILRSCVHCGFCTATCPTYVLLGDELDSPRGRIYLIKDMLEDGKPANEEVTRHIDRCLSCLACMTTCPSGVDYMHLVDHARAHIDETYRRPFVDRLIRALLAVVLPYPGRFRAALARGQARPAVRRAGRGAARRASASPRCCASRRRRLPARRRPTRPGIFPGEGRAQGAGRAAARLRPVGARPRHQRGRDPPADPRTASRWCWPRARAAAARWSTTWAAPTTPTPQAKRNIDAWTREIDGGGLDAIIVTTSGCGTTVKDYGFMLRLDPDYAEKAARVSALAKDMSRISGDARPRRARRTAPALTVAYHAACSLQHGQQVKTAPKALLARAGFEVREPAEAHLCCGSAGTYNMLQPEISGRLRDRKVANIEATGADDRRRRQYRLHHPDRQRQPTAGRPHGRAARLGLWRARSRSGWRRWNHDTETHRPLDNRISRHLCISQRLMGSRDDAACADR